MHIDTPSEELQHFSFKSVVQKCNPIIPLLTSVLRDCGKIDFLICVCTLVVPVDVLPTRYCHSSVGKVEKLINSLQPVKMLP